MCEWKPSSRNRIDPCIRETINNLEISGVRVLGSCCGHDRYPHTIIVRDRDGPIEYNTGTPIPRTRNFYRKDSQGVYYLPEVK